MQNLRLRIEFQNLHQNKSQILRVKQIKVKKNEIAKNLRKIVPWPRKNRFDYYTLQSVFGFFFHRLSDLNSEGDLNKNSHEMDSVTK